MTDKEVDPLIGAIFAGRYEVEKLLGEGGFGRVYLASQLSMGRAVALKTLHKELVTEEMHLRRFYLEARAASKLMSPHVVRIYEFGVDEKTKTPFIAMEFLKGQELGHHLELYGPMPMRRAARVVSQVCKALVDASQQGIVHRDLKPDNIVLLSTATGEDHVKVMDFGVAKLTQAETESGKSLTATGMTVGTPRYMAPEQVLAERVDPRSDLYAVGCILHEVLTGGPPFPTEDRLQLLMSHVSQPAPPLPDPLPTGEPVPPALAIIHQALLAKKREERPPDAHVVAKILEAIEHEKAIDALAMIEEARQAAAQAAERGEEEGADQERAPRITGTATPVVGVRDKVALDATAASGALSISDLVAKPTEPDGLARTQAAQPGLAASTVTPAALDTTNWATAPEQPRTPTSATHVEGLESPAGLVPGVGPAVTVSSAQGAGPVPGAGSVVDTTDGMAGLDPRAVARAAAEEGRSLRKWVLAGGAAVFVIAALVMGVLLMPGSEPGTTAQAGTETQPAADASTAEAADAGAKPTGEEKPSAGEEPAPKRPAEPAKPEEAALRGAPPDPAPGVPSVLPARVYFTTVPAGARIFRSSRRLCTTPCTIKVRAELGSLEVAIRKDGYLDEWVTVDLEAGETARSHIKLISDPGI